MTTDPVRVVLMTAPDADTGQGIARALVEARLAACGNVVPGIRSVFRWEGRVQADDEALVVLKTTASRVEAMMERARALHPYDVPELLALPVTEGSADYLDWVAAETRAEAGR